MPIQQWSQIEVQQLSEAKRKLEIPATAGSASIDASWTFESSTVAADPGSKRFRMDNATLASVTAIYLNDTTASGFDISTLAGFLASGYRIYIQQKADAPKAAIMQLTGTAVDNGGWWTVPVSVVASGTIFDNNAVCAFIFILMA